MVLTTLPTVRRSRITVLSFGTCVLLSSVAQAAPLVEARRDSEEPEPFGYRAAPLPPPQSSVRDFKARVVPAGVPQAQTNVFFLNYDGVTLKHTGDDDAKNNETAFEQFEAEYAPYGDGPKRAASLQAVKADWAKYNVVITDQRPQSGEYTMSVNSPTNVFGGGVLGVAMLDCNDQIAASNIVLAFHSAKDKFSASTQATTISQEIAHAYGLEHVNEPADIMNPYNAGGDPSFRDECLKLDPNAKQLCKQQHAQFCAAGKQNSHAELMWLFGGSEPDAVAPVVSVVYPQDGAQFESPVEVTIAVEASDDVGVQQVDLIIDGINQHAPIKTPPYEWKGAKFPPGTYCVTAEASDAQNKATSAPACFTVTKPGQGPNGGTSGGEPPEGETSGGGEESGGGTSGTGEAPGTGGETSGDGEESGTGEGSGAPAPEDPESDSGASEGDDGVVPVPPHTPGFPSSYGTDDEDGCSCAQDGRAGGGALLLLAGLMGLGRRRRA